jgi:hypothetical protein
LEPKSGERLARINELPPDPPQTLLPRMATYLAGLAAVKSEAPSIVPDDARPITDNLEIPTFLRRADPISRAVVNRLREILHR